MRAPFGNAKGEGFTGWARFTAQVLNRPQMRMLTFTEEILLLLGDDEGAFLPIRQHAFECALAGAGTDGSGVCLPHRHRP